MSKTISTWIAVAVVGSVYLPAFSQQSANPATSPASQYRTVLNRYCVTCHNEKLKTAGLLLDKIDIENVSAGAEVWEKVILKLRSGAMPPAGMPRPDQPTYDSLATYLETSLDRAAAAKPNPGRVPAGHRMNRMEYTNAIHDLLALDIDSKSLLPSDDMGYGFDNIAAVLSISPAALVKYLSAAETIANLALGDSAMHPATEEYKIPPRLMQEERVSEELPLGSRGGAAIRHFFPVDGEYVIKLRMRRGRGREILGLNQQEHIDVYIDENRVQEFTFGGERKRGPNESDEDRHGKDFQYQMTADDALELRLPVKAGAHLVGISFQRETILKNEGLQLERTNAQAVGRIATSRGLGLVIIDGPYNAKEPGSTASRDKIFVCQPSAGKGESACARKIISTLAHRAYRRPVTDADIQPLINLYDAGRSRGGFEAGLRMAVRGILVSPAFLFRIEVDPAHASPGGIYRISDLELASRLSFFLWSSIPDDQLLALAARGKLREPAILERQVRRMLLDPRSRALASNFSGQWLYVRNLDSKDPDAETFPGFSDNLREAFQKETELFFESIVREDHSVLDLLNANYTYLNETLARHYGIPNVYGDYFRRVTLTDANRWGLLGKGSVLMVTSYNSRTAPTLRGKWLLENILGAPPPPPPPNVPSLKDDKEAQKLTMRQRMEQHRANPACAVCHTRMDPLGFALENFDAIGRWRTSSGDNIPIDASGVMPDGTKFQGPAGLRQILMNHREQFVETLTERLLTYALGRGVEYYDRPSIRQIMRDSASSNYRWSSIVLGIASSLPFQMRTAKSDKTIVARR